MTRADIAPFYAPEHRGDPYNKRRVSATGVVTYHRGYDFNRHPVGTPIPSIIGGVVVRNEYQRGLGWIVTVKGQGVWDGWFVGYSHLHTAGAAVGSIIELGDSVGPLGNTGTLTTGPHVHVTAHPYGNNPATAPVRDPWKLVAAALSAPAGTGATPINPGAEPEPEKIKDGTMFVIQPISDSTPLSAPYTSPSGVQFQAGHSRIWAGYKTLDNVEYSDVWGYGGDGVPKRLTKVFWQGLNTKAAEDDRVVLTVVQMSGNELEVMIYGRSY